MLVGNDAAAICDRIYAIFPDHAREARRIQSDTDLGIALLQVIQGGLNRTGFRGGLLA
jgi:hypothetical protein